MNYPSLKHVAKMAYKCGYEAYINRQGPYVPVGFKIANQSWLCGWKQAQNDESGKRSQRLESESKK